MKLNAFTLAELLIALAILGVIATFTVPKVLLAQQSSSYKAMGKEAAGIVSDSYQAFKLSNTPLSTTRASSMIPYINYVAIQTTGSIDGGYGSTTLACNNSEQCLKLHNGGILQMTGSSFTGTQNTNCVHFYFDPNGLPSATTTSGDKSIEFLLYFDGRITTRANYLPNSCSSWGCPMGPTGVESPWFSWN